MDEYLYKIVCGCSLTHKKQRKKSSDRWALRLNFSGKNKCTHCLKLLSFILSCMGKNEQKGQRRITAIPTLTNLFLAPFLLCVS